MITRLVIRGMLRRPPEDYDKSSVVCIELMSYDQKENRLTIIGGSNHKSLFVSINGKSQKLASSGINIPYPFSFRVEIDTKHSLAIEFRTKSNSNTATKLRFTGNMSKLSNTLSYWSFGGMQATHNGTEITIRPKNPLHIAYRESVFIALMLTVWHKRGAAIIRILYWVSSPVLGRRNIWLFTDKIVRAGDNAEYIYRHALKQQDSAHKYYILSNSSPDAERFKIDKIPYVRYKSLRQRLLFLHSNILVFTHNNAPGVYRFGGSNTEYFRGLFNYDIMYAQHGLAIQDTSHLYNKSVDDIRKFFIASPFEEKNLLQPKYGYSPKDIAKTGAPRYDGLTAGAPKRQILIAPTWRRDLSRGGVDYDVAGDTHDSFISTPYFTIYTSLLNNPRLLSFAADRGYSISFLVHPMIAKQADRFKTNPSIQVLSPTENISYESILNESSILVTDYSGLQFDFIFMRKPVIYYHHKKIPPSYMESTYEYKKHSIGQIATKENELIDIIIRTIQKNNKIDKLYLDRADKLFYHHDRLNSKRAYEEILNWQSVENT